MPSAESWFQMRFLAFGAHDKRLAFLATKDRSTRHFRFAHCTLRRIQAVSSLGKWYRFSFDSDIYADFDELQHASNQLIICLEGKLRYCIVWSRGVQEHISTAHIGVIEYQIAP